MDLGRTRVEEPCVWALPKECRSFELKRLPWSALSYEHLDRVDTRPQCDDVFASEALPGHSPAKSLGSGECPSGELLRQCVHGASVPKVPE